MTDQEKEMRVEEKFLMEKQRALQMENEVLERAIKSYSSQ